MKRSESSCNAVWISLSPRWVPSNPSLEEASETIDIDVQMQPYRLENIADKIDTAIKAKNGEIWSQQHAITFVGNVDSVMDEIEQIKEEQADLILGYRFFCKILCF